MVIIGAGGLASEILEVYKETNTDDNICFFDNGNSEGNELLYSKYRVINSFEELSEYFKETNCYDYCIGFGNVESRANVTKRINDLGGKMKSVISSRAFIGSLNVTLGKGIVIMPGVCISNNVAIGDGSLIYYNTVITHDVKVGKYCELSPSVNLLGRVEIGSKVMIGSNSTVLPDIKIQDNVIVGAGSVVTKDLEENSIVYGVPARGA